jgi:hypothetical protein
VRSNRFARSGGFVRSGSFARRGGVVRSGVFVGGRSAFVSNRVFFGSRPFFNRPFGHFRRPFFFNSCFGFFGCSPFFGFGFVGAPLFPGYYPYYYPDYYGYYPPATTEVYSNNGGGNDVELTTEVQRLSDEVADLRDEQRESRSQYPQTAAPGQSISAVPPAASTIFVFRDGRRLTAKNYAITGQALWIFDEHSARRYVLADLDRAATEQANSANGVELRIP